MHFILNKKRYIVWVLFCLFLFPQQSLSKGARGTKNLDEVTLQLKWKHQFQFAGYYAAVKKGIYQKYGLKVNLLEGSPKRRPVSQVLSGKAQYGISSTRILVSYINKKTPLVLLAVIFQRSPQVILTRKSSGIATPLDLIGKKIMIGSMSRNPEAFAMFKKEGIDTSKLNIVPLQWRKDILKNRIADAFSAYITDLSVFESVQEEGLNTILAKNYGVDFYGDNLFTSKKEVTNHPDRVARFKKASLEGWKYALAHQNEMIQYILQKYHPEKRGVTKKHLQYEAKIMKTLILPDVVNVGHINRGRWKHIADTYASLGIVKDKNYNLDDFIYQEPKGILNLNHWSLPWIGGGLSIFATLFFVLLLFNRKLENIVHVRTKELNDVNQKLQNEILEREKSEKSLENILETSNEGFWKIDHQHKTVRVNPMMCRIIGRTEEEFVGKQVVDFLDEENQKIFLEQAEIRREGHSGVYELCFQKSDQSVVVCLVSATPIIEDNQKIGSFALLTDITERKEFEKELHLAKETAEEASRSKSSFLASMSHEIRTPLNAVLGFTELLSGTLIDERQQGYLSSIKSSGKNLLILINDILDLSKIEAKKLTLQEDVVSFSTLLEEMDHIFELKIQEKNLKFILNIQPNFPKNLLLDEIRLRQILFNLIGNAIKFTEKGHIAVSLKSECTSSDKDFYTITIEIEDTGIGISESAQENIFEAFQQQDGQNTKKYGGTGLGLAITKRLVEMMHGTISVQSQVDLGSIFSVALPHVQFADYISPVSDEIDLDLKTIQFLPKKILIVDDVEVNLILLKEILRDSELEIFLARTGEEAVWMTKQKEPDLILMDIRMPVMDGYEATKLIRQDEKYKETPIIAVTASILQREAEQLTKYGFDSYLYKPIQIDLLYQELMKFLPVQKIENQKQKTIVKLPIEVQKTDSVVLNQIHEKLLLLEEKWDSAYKSGLFDEIKDFALEVKAIGEKFEFQSVIEYAVKLMQYVNQFDIENINAQLQHYAILVEFIKDGAN